MTQADNINTEIEQVADGSRMKFWLPSVFTHLD